MTFRPGAWPRLLSRGLRELFSTIVLACAEVFRGSSPMLYHRRGCGNIVAQLTDEGGFAAALHLVGHSFGRALCADVRTSLPAGCGRRGPAGSGQLRRAVGAENPISLGAGVGGVLGGGGHGNEQ